MSGEEEEVVAEDTQEDTDGDGDENKVVDDADDDDDDVGKQPANNDFVIREGFPALRLPGGKGWLIDGNEEPLPRHTFWAQSDALEFGNLALWLRDCELVFSAREREQDEPYSAGVTYFCPAQMKPRCALEALALSIFHLHTKDLEQGVMIPEQSGAEWWTLVLDDDDDNKKESKNDNDDEAEEGDEVGLHFDADYGLEDQAPNLLLHPRLATVTYLTNFGAPTVVFDKRTPPPDDPERKQLEGPIRRGWLSHPKAGKHMTFDGRLLHGAPATFFPPKQEESRIEASDNDHPPPAKKAKLEQKRITVLVNVWINHCPLDAEPLDDDVCESLQTPFEATTAGAAGAPRPSFSWKEVDLKTPTICKRVSLVANDSEPAGEEEFVLCSRLVTAQYGAALRDFHNAGAQGDLIELDMANGVMSLVVGDAVHEDEQDEKSEKD